VDERIFFSSSFIQTNLLTLTVVIKVSLLPHTLQLPTVTSITTVKINRLFRKKRRKTYPLIHIPQNLQHKMASIHTPITLQNKLVNCKNENYS
jgi:hypothetical protein